jgi:hypothetical protein
MLNLDFALFRPEGLEIFALVRLQPNVQEQINGQAGLKSTKSS